MSSPDERLRIYQGCPGLAFGVVSARLWRRPDHVFFV